MQACRSGSGVARVARLRPWQCEHGYYDSAAHTNLPASLQLTGSRGIKLFEIFSKQARTERRRKLKEDMQHGYFDDFRAVRDQQGKIFSSPDRLIDAQVAQPFSPTQMVRPDGVESTIPPPPGQYKAALLCTAFRAGAEDMLASWSHPFRNHYGLQHGAHYYELSFVESAVMSVWPFKQMILRAQLKQARTPAAQSTTPIAADQSFRTTSSDSTPARASSLSSHSTPILGPRDLVQQKLKADGTQAHSAAQSQPQSGAQSGAAEEVQAGASCALQDEHGQHQRGGCVAQEGTDMGAVPAGADASSPAEPLQTDYLFHFGDTTEIRKTLEMPNRLTGYAFLIDSNGLIRWRGSGKAEPAEVDSLLKAADLLLK